MLRHARLPGPVWDRGTALTAAARDWLTGPARHRKTFVLAGTALALTGAGSASAATAPSGSAAVHKAVTATVRHRRAAHRAQPRLQLAAHPQASAPAARPASPPPPPLADQLTPVGTSGQQAWMPISGSQLANATTIVQQTLARHMGIRSAVIAVATAMQESRLQNLSYGSADSLGLFQQRPSASWGSAQQIMSPAYAAGAFLVALQRHQAADPGWAAQPLWANAQAVQASGFPFAYAQWESQAAGLVRHIAASLP